MRATVSAPTTPPRQPSNQQKPPPFALEPGSPSATGTGTPLLPLTTPRAGPGSSFSERYGDDHQAAWAQAEQQVCIAQ